MKTLLNFQKMTPKVLYEFPESGIYTEEGYPFHHLAIGFRYKAVHLKRLKDGKN